MDIKPEHDDSHLSFETASRGVIMRAVPWSTFRARHHLGRPAWSDWQF